MGDPKEPAPSKTTPSPSDIFHLVTPQVLEESPQLDDLISNAVSRFPESVSFLESMGLEFELELKKWSRTPNQDSRIRQFLAEDLDPWSFSRLIENSFHPELVETVLVEELLFKKLAEFGPRVRKFSEVVSRYYANSATQLSRILRKLPTNKEVDLANAALASSTAIDRILINSKFPEVVMDRWLAQRMVAVVREARFSIIESRVLEKELQSVAEGLEANLWQIPYFVEGLCKLFDLRTAEIHDEEEIVQFRSVFGQLLNRAIRATSQISNIEPVIYLSLAEALIRLAGDRRNLANQVSYLKKAQSYCDLAVDAGWDSELLTVRLEMLEITIQQLMNSDFLGYSFAGISFPFAYKRPRTTSLEILDLLGPHILGQISNSREFIYRDISASIASYLATDSTLDNDQRLEYLKIAGEMRRGKVGRDEPLQGPNFILDTAKDLCLRFEIGGAVDNQFRYQALDIWMSQISSRDNRLEALSRIAWEIHANGAAKNFVPRPHKIPIDEGTQITEGIRSGNSRALFELSARAALNFRTRRSQTFGARGGVEIVYMSRNGFEQEFVFKTLQNSQLEWEARRAESILRAIESNKLEKEYGVPEYLAHIEIPDSYPPSSISVRTYSEAKRLWTIIEKNSPEGFKIIGECITFLALIHANSDVPDGKNTPRASYKNRIGLWLRKLVSQDERSRLFEDWWRLVADAPKFSKRDAHAGNWLVEEGGRIIAIDLDSSEPTFFGDELAQLLLDVPGDREVKFDWLIECLETYVDELHRFGESIDVPHEKLKQYFFAGVAARALGLMTNQKLGARYQNHGAKLLDLLSNIGIPSLELWSREILDAWRKAGAAITDEIDNLPNAEKIRISRTMSRILRHDPSAELNREGWMAMDVLVQKMREAGRNVNSEDLAALAGPQGDSRFELNRENDDIRALYGHSNKSVEIKLLYQEAPPLLFHATPVDNLREIVELKQGLRSMERAFVHLTSNPSRAYQSAQRFGKPIVLFAIDTKFLKEPIGRPSPGSDTWLTSDVPLESIRLVPIGGLILLLRNAKLASSTTE